MPRSVDVSPVALPPRPPPGIRLGWPRFSLRTLLLIVTGMAITCGCVIGMPWVFSLLLALVRVALFSALAAGIVFGQGDVRAFCIGGGVGLLSLVLFPHEGSPVPFAWMAPFADLLIPIVWVAGICLGGAVSVVTRRRFAA